MDVACIFAFSDGPYRIYRCSKTSHFLKTEQNDSTKLKHRNDSSYDTLSHGRRRKDNEIDKTFVIMSSNFEAGSSRPRRYKPNRLGGHPIRRKGTAVNHLKKRIRDINRLLERSESMPADVRINNERALAAYKQDLSVASHNRLEQKLSKKYHMVRFFGKLYSWLYNSNVKDRYLLTSSNRETKGDTKIEAA
jgi:hypothetical protein